MQTWSVVLAAVPELDGRVLRIIVSISEPKRVITAHLDRKETANDETARAPRRIRRALTSNTSVRCSTAVAKPLKKLQRARHGLIRHDEIRCGSREARHLITGCPHVTPTRRHGDRNPLALALEFRRRRSPVRCGATRQLDFPFQAHASRAASTASNSRELRSDERSLPRISDGLTIAPAVVAMLLRKPAMIERQGRRLWYHGKRRPMVGPLRPNAHPRGRRNRAPFPNRRRLRRARRWLMSSPRRSAALSCRSSARAATARRNSASSR